MSKLTHNLEKRLKRLSPSRGIRQLIGAYKQIVVSNKGKQAKGEYRDFVEKRPYEAEELGLFVAGQLDSKGLHNHAERVRNRFEPIRVGLHNKIKATGIDKRINVDSSAYDALKAVSQNGQWHNGADIYAGTAILNVLQAGGSILTGKDVKEATPFEAIQLMLGGKDIWEEITYIGTTVPTMLPEGVGLGRLLKLWDANRDKDIMDSTRDGKLPQYAMTDGINYSEKGVVGGPEVKIPFRYNPSKGEVEAVAQSVAIFVSETTGIPHEVEDISRGGMDSFGVQYFVRQTLQPGQDKFLVGPSYRVSKGFAFGLETDAQGVVTLTREMGCKHEANVLDLYAQSVKAKPAITTAAPAK